MARYVGDPQRPERPSTRLAPRRSNCTARTVSLNFEMTLFKCLGSSEAQNKLQNTSTRPRVVAQAGVFAEWKKNESSHFVLSRWTRLMRFMFPDYSFRGLIFPETISRSCSANGQWLPTNYYTCFTEAHLEYIRVMTKYLRSIKRVSFIGYSTSLILLIAAFILLVSLK